MYSHLYFHMNSNLFTFADVWKCDACGRVCAGHAVKLKILGVDNR